MTRPLSPPFDRLTELALDMRLTGSQLTARIWKLLDPDAWDRIYNPFVILQNAHVEKLQALAENSALRSELESWLDRRDRYLNTPGWFRMHHQPHELRGVAYFSMEFALGEALPIYSGGLGGLAGDHLKSASDLDLPLVGIGLLYQQGYFRQVLSRDGWQLEAFPFNDPSTLPVVPVVDADGRWPRVRLELPGRTLFLRVWSVQVGKIRLYLLDSNHPLNNPWDRGITSQLYPAARETRLLQEMVLGIGGWRLLEKLRIEVDVCHLNEGHAAFAILARAASFALEERVSFAVALRATRSGNVFTTHTPVDAAFDKFPPELLQKYAQPFADLAGIPLPDVLAMGRKNPRDESEPFNMAYLALRGSGYVNGVSRLHGKVSRSLFRGLFPDWPEAEVPVAHVTNGVHMPTWDSVPANELWSSVYPGRGRWLANLDEAALGIGEIDDGRIWEFRTTARQLLVAYVRRRLERQVRELGRSEEQIQQARHVLDPNVLTLGFARRFTEYKRPMLILADAERFAAILRDPHRPVQFIVAGKAHPSDHHGKRMIQAIAQFAARSDLQDRIVFLEDYDITLAQYLAGGIDVWINTPRRPAEACGTSGMKILINGGLNVSALDGWWDEAYRPDVGWALGSESHAGERDSQEALQLYELLERCIVPEFYQRDESGLPVAWIRRMRASMATLAPQFSSDRMLRDYVKHAYLPCAAAYQRRVFGDAAEARELDQWFAELQENWHGLRFGEVRVRHEEQEWEFEVDVWFGDLLPESVLVELYADPLREGPPTRRVMTREAPLRGAINGFSFRARVPADRPSHHYTPRVVPFHERAAIPLEASRILWCS